LDEKSDDGTRAHLQNVNGLAILHQDKHVLGFASAFFPKEDLFYLHGVAIASSIKGRGAARALVEALRRSSGSGDMSFTTQNPSMFCLLQSMCERVYPNPNEAMPVHLQTKAKRLMERRAGTFDSSSGVAKNLYGRCLYPHIPASRDDSINEWFSSKLNIRENQTRHAFLFIGEGVR
jgi:hypothetical protein